MPDIMDDLTSDIMNARAAVGAAERHHPNDYAQLAAKRQRLEALKLERQVRRVLADWPTLPDEQLERIAALLRAGGAA